MTRFIFALLIIMVSLAPSPALAEVTYYDSRICIPAKVMDEKGQAKMMMSLELAIDNDSIKRGLMYRNYLAPQGGMIFIFQPPEKTAMWMKNTLIPLDMVFVGQDEIVLNVHRGAKPHDLTPIWSDGVAQYVIELQAGAIDRYGLAAGQRLELPNGLFNDL